nr:glucosaminidase domain-containing protein [uncultured Carboxylicivirga sp.]
MSKISRKNGVVITLGILLLLIAGLFIWLRVETSPVISPFQEIYVDSPDSIVIQSDSLVEPIIYHGNPDLRKVRGEERKDLFVNLMLPSIMIAQKKVERERKKLERLAQKIEKGRIRAHDSLLVDSIVAYFKCKDIHQVINSLEQHPVSIILAQAAIESGWGTSRFFLEANNVFGIWSYNEYEERIAASETRDDNTIYLRKYNNLYGSVYDYLITVARAPAYKKLREVRLESDDPYELIQYLVNYSELRDEYVKILGAVIRQNDFTQYDHYKLVEIDEDDPLWQSL